MNLLLWFHYNEDGEVSRLAKLEIMPPEFDLDKHFVDYMKPPFRGGGVDRIERERVVIPPYLIGVDATAYVLYHDGKRFACAMPYFQKISPA